MAARKCYFGYSISITTFCVGLWHEIYMLYLYGPVTWGGLSGLDLREALKMSKILGKIKIRLFLGQVLNLSEE